MEEVRIVARRSFDVAQVERMRRENGSTDAGRAVLRWLHGRPRTRLGASRSGVKNDALMLTLWRTRNSRHLVPVGKSAGPVAITLGSG